MTCYFSRYGMDFGLFLVALLFSEMMMNSPATAQEATAKPQPTVVGVLREDEAWKGHSGYTSREAEGLKYWKARAEARKNMQKEYDALEKELRAVSDKSSEEGRNLSKKLLQLRNKLDGDYPLKDPLDLLILAEYENDMRKAIEIVCKRRGIDILLRSRILSNGNEILYFNEKVDVTEDVKEELKAIVAGK